VIANDLTAVRRRRLLALGMKPRPPAPVDVVSASLADVGLLCQEIEQLRSLLASQAFAAMDAEARGFVAARSAISAAILEQSELVRTKSGTEPRYVHRAAGLSEAATIAREVNYLEFPTSEPTS